MSHRSFTTHAVPFAIQDDLSHATTKAVIGAFGSKYNLTIAGLEPFQFESHFHVVTQMEVYGYVEIIFSDGEINVGDTLPTLTTSGRSYAQGRRRLLFFED